MNERIKTIRINAGLTQQQFADRIKVKRNTVPMKWEEVSLAILLSH